MAMRSFWFTIFVILGAIACLPLAHAFGAGEIPDYAAIKGLVTFVYIAMESDKDTISKSFRHGDIENVLLRLIKDTTGKSSGGLLESAASFLGAGNSAGGKTFTTADVKHIYFGNWLRDYCKYEPVECSSYSDAIIAQAMDLAGLTKMTKETIIMVLSVLSFMVSEGCTPVNP